MTEAREVINPRPIDEEAEPQRPSSEEDVLPDVEIAAQSEVLIDHLDTAIAAFLRASEAHRFAVVRRFSADLLDRRLVEQIRGRIVRRA